MQRYCRMTSAFRQLSLNVGEGYLPAFIFNITGHKRDLKREYELKSSSVTILQSLYLRIFSSLQTNPRIPENQLPIHHRLPRDLQTRIRKDRRLIGCIHQHIKWSITQTCEFIIRCRAICVIDDLIEGLLLVQDRRKIDW